MSSAGAHREVAAAAARVLCLVWMVSRRACRCGKRQSDMDLLIQQRASRVISLAADPMVAAGRILKWSSPNRHVRHPERHSLLMLYTLTVWRARRSRRKAIAMLYLLPVLDSSWRILSSILFLAVAVGCFLRRCGARAAGAFAAAAAAVAAVGAGAE